MGITCGTAHLSEREKTGLVERTMDRGEDGERLERECRRRHQSLISLTPGSNSWSDGFLPSSALDSAARAVSHESTAAFCGVHF